ncbi:MAG TPA: sugar porter family MFS transporter [Steroidobacteraceae bacterium]|jgi:SP family arabinose:H+ symporter-like MFS transporter|nr:sugar porter family MFS transporter [Steroidobacteraceae bacterium]
MSPFSSIGTILIIALSGMLLGFDGSLFTGAVVFVKDQFALTDFELGWTVSSHTLSATVSIFLAGPLADRIGRRTVLRIATLMFGVSAIVAAAANGYAMLIVARLLSGLGVGAVFVAAPMYIAEISPPALRGRMVTVNQLFLVCGIFLASVNNLAIVQLERLPLEWLARFNLAESNWRWMLGIGVVPAAIYLVALLFVPESPRWHALHGRLTAARRILVRAHGDELAERELAEVSASLAHDTRTSDASLRELLAPQLRGVLFIGMVVGVLQQITGINAVLGYAPMIFARAGNAGIEAPFVQTALITLVNVVSTVVALLLIDRVGRRPLLIFGTAGIAGCLFAAAWGFHASEGGSHSGLVLLGLLGFVACFALSLGPVMWVLLSEIFPNRVRALAISCVGLVNSTVCFLAQLVFPWQMENLGGAQTFLIYAVFAVLGVAMLVRILPETRGRSLEELEESLVRNT